MFGKIARKFIRRGYQAFIGATCALTVLSLAGLTELAHAATTCNTNTFEGFFLSDDGRSTYAITKTPMTWANARAAAVAAGGRLAIITEKEQSDSLVENLVEYFTTAPPPSSPSGKAWIGLHDPANTGSWTMEGQNATIVPQRFTWADGFSNYTNWESGQPDGYCTNAERQVERDGNCFGEQWAALSSTGTWSDEGDHGTSSLTLKGIVEWYNNALDCVKIATPPEQPKVLPITGDDPNQLWCTNSSQSSLVKCIETTGGGQLCPLEKVACNSNVSPPVCPDGSVLNTERDMCQAEATISCGDGYTYDPEIDRCVREITCPDGGVFNGVTDRCEKIVSNQCPSGYTYNSELDVCSLAVNCGDGAVFNPAQDRCERPPAWDCPIGHTYNGVDGKCEADPYCSTGTEYNKETNRCEATATVSCPDGYTYDPGTDTCIASPSCSAPSALNKAKDRCEMPIGVACPEGYTFDSDAGTCYRHPACSPSGHYFASVDLCTAEVSGTTCPYGYTYDSAQNKCVHEPICPESSYNAERDRCEAVVAASCPEGYSLNTDTQVCEQLPACQEGSTYNATRNRCELNISSCPAGSSWDTSLNTCVASAICSDGSTLNGDSDMCEMAVSSSCPSGYTWNATRSACEAPPTCASPGTYSAANDLCTVAGTPSCPTGYSWSIAYALCIKAPTCVGGTYSWDNNRCEANPTATCSDASYTYNSTRGRCEKNPVCSQGTYNTTYNKCLLSATLGCPTGYTLNATRNRCERTPVCASGTYNTSTNKCETTTTTTYAATASFTQGCSISSQYPVGCSATVAPGGIFVVRTSAEASCGVGQPNGKFEFGVRFDNNCNVTGKSSPLTTRCSSALYCSTSFTINAMTPVPPGGTFTNVPPGVVYTNASNGTYTCPSGGTLSGTTCTVTSGSQTNPTCPSSGSLDTTNDVCYAAQTQNCPTGMTYDATAGMCAKAATCTNGVLDTAVDKCYMSATMGACPSGYTASGSICIRTPTCTSPGTYNAIRDHCITNSTGYNCPSGYAWDSARGQCVVAATCSSGGTLDTAVDQCQTADIMNCLSGYTLSGTACQKPPVCAATGVYSPDLNKCDNGANVCGEGFTLDGAIDRCHASASCGEGGALNTSTGMCQTVGEFCGAEFIFDGENSVCHKTAYCNAFGNLNTEIDKCDASDAVSFSCPPGYGYNAALGMCSHIPDCAGGTLNPAVDKCQASGTGYTCGTDYLKDIPNNVCYQSPGCMAGGSYNHVLDVCENTSSKNCGATALTYDAYYNVCFAQAQCGEGSLNVTKDKCEAEATPDCGDWAMDAGSGVCYSPPACFNGAFDSTANECRAAITRECGSYVWNETDTKCTNDVTCPDDPGFSEKATIGFSPELDKCISQAEHLCHSGMTFSSVPVNKCEAFPFCSSGEYNPIKDNCSAAYTCPSGPEACHQIAGDTTEVEPGVPMTYCSPNPCQGDSSGWVSTDDTESGLTDKKNDGPRDDDGNCLGQLYILNGNDMRCRVYDNWGMVNSYAKLVAQIVLACTGVGAALAGALAITGAVGTAVVNAAVQLAVNAAIDGATGQPQAGLVSVGTTLIAAGIGGYISSGSAPAGDIGGMSSADYSIINNASSIASQSGYNSASLLADATGFSFVDAISSSYTGTFLDQAQQVANQSAFSTFMGQVQEIADQYSPAISQGMFGNYTQTKCCYPDKLSGSCERSEIKTATLEGNGLCHEVGSYCSSKMLFVCMVKKKTSCCFGSKLARLIHEQGRPQLTNFGAKGGWGEPRNPVCRGFTPTEFQSLDFSQMDLTEFIEEITDRMSTLSPALEGYMGQVGQQIQSSAVPAPNF